MHLGKAVRLNRIFSHPSGRLCSVAVDHFVGYQKGLPQGLVNVPHAIRQLIDGRPDAITMHRGMALQAWPTHAGVIPLIISSVLFTLDDAMIDVSAEPEDVVRMGADAIAVAIGVRGPREGAFLRILSDQVAKADRLNLPVIAHIYPRDYSNGPTIVTDPENIMWAVRAGVECGADVVKVPFTGDAASFRDIIATSPVPVVAAGGPRTETLHETLAMLGEAIKAGARGATIGRNIWGSHDPTQMLLACKAMIHDTATPEEAIALAGLGGV